MFGKKPSVAKLQQKSNNILDIFTKTANELKAVNTEISVVIADKEVEKKQIEDDITVLNSQLASNFKVLYNINKIFS